MGMRGIRGRTPTKPKHTEESIQQALYWNHPILTKPAFEMVGFIFYAWESDYLAISKAGYVYECEINYYVPPEYINTIKKWITPDETHL